MFTATASVGAIGVRDAAPLAVLYGGGLRRAEAVGLDVDSYDPGTGKLAVLGKGNKTRIVPVNETAQAALAEWLKLRGTEPGPLSLAVHRSGRIDPARTRMSTTSVYRFTKRQAERANVAKFAPARPAPHFGRRHA